MTAEWSEAPPAVLAMATKLIDEYHPHLLDARIGFLMRSEASKSGGKVTLGQARRVTGQWQVYADFDFIIWLAEDYYDEMTGSQRLALIDHELCHCRAKPAGWTLRHHDIEEFTEIIERHGAWSQAIRSVAKAIQGTLPLNGEHRGKVAAAPISIGAGESIDAALQAAEMRTSNGTLPDLPPVDPEAREIFDEARNQ